MSHKQKHFRFFFTILLLALEAWLAVMLYRRLRAYGVRLPDRESALLRAFTVARLQTAIPTSGLVPDPVAPSPTATVTPTATPLPPTQTAQPTATRPAHPTAAVDPYPGRHSTADRDRDQWINRQWFDRQDGPASGGPGRRAQCHRPALGHAAGDRRRACRGDDNGNVGRYTATSAGGSRADNQRAAGQPSPTWTVVYVLPTPAAVDLFDAATRVARVTLAATTTGTATPLPPNWRVYTIRIVPYEPPPANHATATMLALAATARRHHR
ncbi:MAG: hypothetical protein R2867_17160 [Caldilineaceae bacterium]